jgi:uncharacterized cofD-like protein
VIGNKLQEIQQVRLSPLDLLPQLDLREKIVDLVLRGVPENVNGLAKQHLFELRQALLTGVVEDVRVVVFGGGTGLSNIVGGDSRIEGWKKNPFVGLKEVFPQTRSVVCVTDNGGSTGELLKDLPLMAIGDIRHVLLSSIVSGNLQKRYTVDIFEAKRIVGVLAVIFNLRFPPPFDRSAPQFCSVLERLNELPRGLQQHLHFLLEFLITDPRLSATLQRPHCLGNLLVAAAIYREIDKEISHERLVAEPEILHSAIFRGINSLGRMIGTCDRAVLPCTSTPAQLRVLYTNGVEILGEDKLSKSRRGFPVERVCVDYCDTVKIYEELLEEIVNADIVILAPGSLYSSIIPVFKVPGLAEAVRRNRQALKILVANLWVQAGETDLSLADPERKFHVSDMIRAYEKNIPGGTRDLFSEVLCISLGDIPASVLQRYAVEGKAPIFVDRQAVSSEHYLPIECGVYSREALQERGVIQHDPDILALAIKGLYNSRACNAVDVEVEGGGDQEEIATRVFIEGGAVLPCQRYAAMKRRLERIEVGFHGEGPAPDGAALRTAISEILWDHPVIPLSHLGYLERISCVDPILWNRDQQWDNVFSFFDPDDWTIKIRSDQLTVRQNLEIALMISLGESLLGDYALRKEMVDAVIDGVHLGRVYHLYLRPEQERRCFLSPSQLRVFLSLARMCSTDDELHYTRLINKGEGFTPPGLLMGLMYAWYIDNRLASHIEYKMSLMKINQTDLIPEQLKMAERRKKMVAFFREVIFGEGVGNGEGDRAEGRSS